MPRSPSRRVRVVAGLGAAALALGLSAVVSQAHADETPDVLTYEALGDSYSSGHGAWLSGESLKTVYPTDADHDCRRSIHAWPLRFIEEYKQGLATKPTTTTVGHRACSGAKMDDVSGTQLGNLSADTDIVTLTIGGNDVHFATVAAACTLSEIPDQVILDSTFFGNPTICGTTVAAAEKFDHNAFRDKLTSLLGSIAQKAPNAIIVQSGYPRLFSLTDCGVPSIAGVNRKAIDDAVDDINSTVSTAVTAADKARQATNPKAPAIRFTDPNLFFEGHRICDKDPWINSPSEMALKEISGAYHPEVDGHGALAQNAAAAALGGKVGF